MLTTWRAPAMIDAMIRWATGRRAALAVVALLIGGFALFQLGPYATVKHMTNAPSLPEETLTTPAALAGFLDGLDEPTRTAYARFQKWDLLNLALFGTTGVLVLGWLLNLTNLAATRWRWLVVLPLALVLADVTENGLLGLAIGRFPEAIRTSAGLLWVTGTKFVALIMMLLAAALLSATAVIQRVQGGRRKA